MLIGSSFVAKTNAGSVSLDVQGFLALHEVFDKVSGVVVDGGANLQSASLQLGNNAPIGSNNGFHEETYVAPFQSSWIAHMASKSNSSACDSFENMEELQVCDGKKRISITDTTRAIFSCFALIKKVYGCFSRTIRSTI